MSERTTWCPVAHRRPGRPVTEPRWACNTGAMSVHVMAITFDCSHALTLAGFWSEAVGRPIDQEGDMAASEFFARIPGDGNDPMMMFIQVPEGKTAKNRMHLDMNSTDPAAEVERLVGLGASVIHTKNEYGMQWTTLADPEGNEFCVANH